jgi:hypothetical protein
MCEMSFRASIANSMNKDFSWLDLQGEEKSGKTPATVEDDPDKGLPKLLQGSLKAPRGDTSALSCQLFPIDPWTEERWAPLQTLLQNLPRNPASVACFEDPFPTSGPRGVDSRVDSSSPKHCEQA